MWRAQGEQRERWHHDDVVRAYLLAKFEVLEAGYEEEITWQEALHPERVTPASFVQEAAWVVLCAGMGERTVRARFHPLRDAFFQWNPATISQNADDCRYAALSVFNHRPKVDSIIQIAEHVDSEGVSGLMRGGADVGPTYFTRLPFIGPVTCFHLAKNLGFPVSKPDRHLERIALLLGYPSVHEMCEMIAAYLDEPIQVVDLVMWRYATINRRYQESLMQMCCHVSDDSLS